MWQAVRTIGIDYRKKLVITFILVALENILFLKLKYEVQQKNR